MKVTVQRKPPKGGKRKGDKGESTPKDAELSSEARKWFGEKGRIGGLARVTKGFGVLSPAQRRANSRAAAKARWAKVKGGTDGR